MSSSAIKPESLRSYRWYGPDDLRSFGHRSRTKQMGLHRDEFLGKPVIGIINTWNEMNTCHTHFPQRVQDIKRGVLFAGGFPVELPAMSLGEQLMKPTAMMYRNFLAMEVEELLRSYPIDGAVLMGGCDKTTPALLMGAASADIPSILVTGGPQLKGNWKGEELGSCTDCRRYEVELRAGNITEDDWAELQSCIVRSSGHCMTMGTASTMAMMGEAIGMALPDNASIPAVDSRRVQMAEEAGRRAVSLAGTELIPSKILTLSAFENAIRCLHASGGSTNAIIHLIAIAGRVGIELPLELFDDLAKTTPFILNLKPSGNFLMEDFYYSGGTPALMKRIESLLDLDNMTITGETLGMNISGYDAHNDDVTVSYTHLTLPTKA